MGLLAAAESLPFMVAALIVLAIGVIEGVAVLSGVGLSTWLDAFSPDAAADSWLGWLHVGKVPMLVLLVLLLTAFALIGLVFNAIVHSALGIYPYRIVSIPIAVIGAIPIVRIFGATIARFIPKDESSAISLDTLVGHVAVIITGTAKVNYPAEAKVKNEQAQTFYVRVEPEEENTVFREGESVLLVKQISGARFMAIANPRPDIL